MARNKTFKIKLLNKMKKGDIIGVQVQPKYPSTTGLGLIGQSDDFIRKEPPVYLKEMKVTFNDKEVCSFVMTAAVSPDPRIEFPFKVEESGTLKVTFTSNSGEVFESIARIKV